MFFRQRINGDASVSYLFGCGGKGRALAVDVLAGDEAWFLEEAARHGAQIAYVIDTHVHADHLSGGRALAGLSGARYALHASNRDRAGFAFLPLADGDVLEAGNVVVRVLHTPGHTDDSVCLLVTDLRRGPAPWFVLTGDTLLVGAVGRPDLGGSPRAMAARLWHSLHDKLFALPDELEVYPGHVAGSACGAGISGKPSSTTGFEKRHNALLALGIGQFVDELVATLPPPPQGAERFVALNLGQGGAAGQQEPSRDERAPA